MLVVAPLTAQRSPAGFPRRVDATWAIHFPLLIHCPKHLYHPFLFTKKHVLTSTFAPKQMPKDSEKPKVNPNIASIDMSHRTRCLLLPSSHRFSPFVVVDVPAQGSRKGREGSKGCEKDSQGEERPQACALCVHVLQPGLEREDQDREPRRQLWYVFIVTCLPLPFHSAPPVPGFQADKSLFPQVMLASCWVQSGRSSMIPRRRSVRRCMLPSPLWVETHIIASNSAAVRRPRK